MLGRFQVQSESFITVRAPRRLLAFPLELLEAVQLLHAHGLPRPVLENRYVLHGAGSARGRGVGLPGTRARHARSARGAGLCLAPPRSAPRRLELSSALPPAPPPSLPRSRGSCAAGSAKPPGSPFPERSECHLKSLPPCQHFWSTPAALHLCLFSLSLHRSPVREISQRRRPESRQLPPPPPPSRAARAASAFKETGSIFQNSWATGRLLCPRPLYLPPPPPLLPRIGLLWLSLPAPPPIRGAALSQKTVNLIELPQHVASGPFGPSSNHCWTCSTRPC